MGPVPSKFEMKYDEIRGKDWLRSGLYTRIIVKPIFYVMRFGIPFMWPLYMRCFKCQRSLPNVSDCILLTAHFNFNCSYSYKMYCPFLHYHCF